jgi:hypothetical protein
MYRLTAGVLLVLLLVSVIAPVALAASAPLQACCTRKCCAGKAPHTHPSSERSFDTPACCHQDCGCSFTVSLWAELATPVSVGSACPSAVLPPDSRLLSWGKLQDASHSVRGPPLSSIA